jgi:hypothetical protein
MSPRRNLWHSPRTAMLALAASTLLSNASSVFSQSVPLEEIPPQSQYVAPADGTNAPQYYDVVPADGSAASQEPTPVQLASGRGAGIANPQLRFAAPVDRRSEEAPPEPTPEATPNGRQIAPQAAAPILIGGKLVPTLPFFINDVVVAARAAAVYDTTRLNPEAGGHFFTSAIPVQGDPFYGAGGRSSVQGSGSGVGLGFGFGDPNSAISAHVLVEAVNLSSDSASQDIGLIQAYGQWERLTFGATDSAFTDLSTMPNTFDAAGPLGRPAIYGQGQPQIRFAYLQSPEATGFNGAISVEMPGADVNLPKAPEYSTFSTYPDLVANIRYQVAKMVTDPCDNQKYAIEYWHVQFGALVRDIGVEGDGMAANDVRKTTTGWGTQLSGQIALFADRNSDDPPKDSVIFSLTWGRGIGHYFADLHNVSPVNDAVYDATTNTLTALPLFANCVGYRHDWATHIRSDVVYGHVELDSKAAPQDAKPYHRGDYMSINLVLHGEPCHPRPELESDASKRTRRVFMGGMEYLFGQRENLAGDWGADQRILLFFAASN